jgi:drug/metabolite transporter superfamily protein YnfA
MSLDHNEFIELSKIADFTRRTDPELVRKLAAPMRQRRSWWVKTSHVTTLALCAILLLAGLVTNDLRLAAVGGLALLTSYPLLAVMTKRRKDRRNGRGTQAP